LQDINIILELNGKFLRLIDASNGNELISQRLNSVRQWSAGPDTDRSAWFSVLSLHIITVRGSNDSIVFLCELINYCTWVDKTLQEHVSQPRLKPD